MSLDIRTFGCRLNAYESEIIRREAGAAVGDAIIVNTCAVTAEAVRQARQAIRKARRENPGRRIIVTGCAAQTEPEAFAAMAEVDLVLGNAEKTQRTAWELAAERPFGLPAPAEPVALRLDALLAGPLVRGRFGHLVGIHVGTEGRGCSIALE